MDSGTPVTALDLNGFTEREPGTWTSAEGLVLTAQFIDLVPDLPAPLAEPDRLLNALAKGVAARGACLVEARVTALDSVPAVQQLIKVRLPGREHGLGFIGSWTLPRATCSTVVKVQAAEEGTTGVREAMTLVKAGPENYLLPHPYGADVTGGLPYHIADLEEYDADFPDHPLTRVRAALRRIAPSVRLDDGFKARAPFDGPAAGGGRRWFRRRKG
ncbi:hypothetical protein [Streptomyces sp. NPDC050560]|uniref:hypothetical protein n=1 Tax=Streptomyces sp. NPDC050560 TaxID=3365630 RepID=UPI00378B15E7